MLAERRRELSAMSWREADVNSWHPPEPPDLIFSSAAFQWVPAHETLFLSVLQRLRPGGALAIQMPRHFESPSHLELKDLVQQSEWRAQLEPQLLPPVPSPETCCRCLSPHARNVDLCETIYLQALDGAHPAVNFIPRTPPRPLL